MKKKVLMLGIGLALGSALVVTSAFAGIGGAEGYEAYKSALRNTATVSSMTHHIALTLQDNGNQVMSVNSTVKANKAAEDVSGNAVISAGGTSQSIDFYNQGDKKILKAGNNDTYYVLTDSDKIKWKRNDGHNQNPELSKEMENVVDALVGNLKNNFTLSKADGGRKTVEVKLSGSQIPSAANVIGSILVKEALSGEGMQDEMDHQSFGESMLGVDARQIAAHFPKLTQDVNIDEVSLQATIDENNYISGQEIDFTISGKDDAGQAHRVVISVNMEMSNINKTTPESVNLAGKKTQSIDTREFDR